VFHIALYQPEIPPNTGNIIRLCANAGANLHLIHPLGFTPTDKHLKRAGLDYHVWADIHHHQTPEDFFIWVGSKRIYALSTFGNQRHSDVAFAKDDVFLFGPETKGLPKQLLANHPFAGILNIPMTINSRSLNLSNAAAIVLYEAWRQLGFVAE